MRFRPAHVPVWPLLFIAVAGVLVVSSWSRQQPPASPELRLPLDRTLSVGRQVSLRVEGVRGSIAIRTGKEGSLAVRASHAAQEASSNPTAEDVALTLVQEEDTVTLVAPHPASGWVGWVREIFSPTPTADLQVTLAVPEDTSVDLRAVAGAVTVTAIKGSVALQGDQVTVNFSDIGGALEVDIQGGSVAVSGGGGGETCRFALGAAALWGRKLSCRTLEARGERDLRLEDADVAQEATLTTRAGEVRVARLRAEGLEGRTARGRIVLQESTIAGRAALENASGDVAVHRANAGTLRATAPQGSIEFTEVQGDLVVHAPRGKVTLRRVLARSLDVRGGAAEVLVSGEFLPAEGHRIQTTGGSVTLYLRRESSLRVQADTGAGALVVDRALAPDTAEPVRGRNVREVNGGAVALEVITGGGDVFLRTGDPLF